MIIKNSQLRNVIRKLIKESMGQYRPTEIYMDIIRKGGPDHFCAMAHEKPGMKCTDYLHYDHALRAYIDTEAPHLDSIPNNIWHQITDLLRATVR